MIDELAGAIMPTSNLYDIYISLEGSDIIGTGTLEKPFRTINKALESIPSTSRCEDRYVIINLLQNESNDAVYDVTKTLNVYNFPWIRKIIFNGNDCTINFNVDKSIAINMFTKPMVTFCDCRFNFISFNDGVDIPTRIVKYECTLFDENGNPLQIYYPENNQIVNISYKNNNLIDYFETLGYRTTFKYNENDKFIGKITTVISENPAPKESDISNMLTEDFDYTEFDSNNNPKMIVYENGGVVSLFYRSDNQIDHYHIKGYNVIFLYDDNGVFIGKKTEETDKPETSSNMELTSEDYTCTVDEDGNPLTITYSNGQQVTLNYNSQHIIQSATTLGCTVNFLYNDLGVFIGKSITGDSLNQQSVPLISSPISDDISTLLTSIYTYKEYDEFGNPILLEFEDGQRVNFTYNDDGQINYIETVGYRTTYNYENGYYNGKITTKLLENANKSNDTNNILTEDYTYTEVDSNYQPVELTYKSGQIVKFEYREDGQLKKYSSDNYIVTLDYDSNGFLIGKNTEYIEPDAPTDVSRFISKDFTCTVLDDNIDSQNVDSIIKIEKNLNVLPNEIINICKDVWKEYNIIVKRPTEILDENDNILTISYTETKKPYQISSSLNNDLIVFGYNEDDYLLGKYIDKFYVYDIYVDERSGVSFENCIFNIQKSVAKAFLLDRDSTCYLNECIINANNLNIDYLTSCFNSSLNLLNTQFKDVRNKLLLSNNSSIKLNDTVTINDRQITSDDYDMFNVTKELISN